MHGQCAHPIHIGDDLNPADDTAQFAGHRLLQRQQCNGTLFGTRAQRLDLVVVADHLLRRGEVGLQQRPGRALHRGPGQTAQRAQLVGQLR